ncbi:DUF4082 domain-containing protein [Microbacterium wangchenii]|uniref:DUF4082 domain-containing protein n=1 Tax=Microbacterium wangchenii TaxID=2541726 RepID=A0ABX5T0E1_9MICO|nr:DUF4082 domain-containing protein [Microbacterium wangchenii]TXK16213.1 DUF4082 domain-containing protein [Microbacterium wangchenii]
MSASAPVAAALDVSPTTTVSATLSPAPASATVALQGPLGAAIAGDTAYDAATGELVFTPSEPLAWSTAYTVTVSSSEGDISGATWTFSTAAEPVVADVRTIFGDGTPQHPWWADSDAVQVATRFTVDTAGNATGVRFYKGEANTGQHTGYLWNAAGERIAEVEFVDETADGWQTAQFAAPVPLLADTEYRVGLYSTTGRYAVDLGTLAFETRVGPFTIPGHGSAFTYGRGYPAELTIHNYWVDITFDGAG